jgi:hypothetical protein
LRLIAVAAKPNCLRVIGMDIFALVGKLAALDYLDIELGSVGIHREFITAAARWIMEAKL